MCHFPSLWLGAYILVKARGWGGSAVAPKNTTPHRRVVRLARSWLVRNGLEWVRGISPVTVTIQRGSLASASARVGGFVRRDSQNYHQKGLRGSERDAQVRSERKELFSILLSTQPTRDRTISGSFARRRLQIGPNERIELSRGIVRTRASGADSSSTAARTFNWME